MPSPLEISHILVSQSDHDVLDYSYKQSPYHDSIQSNPIPILLHIHKTRVLAGTIVGTTLVSGLVYFLSEDGIVLTTLTTYERSWLQDYNALAGGLVALMIKPLEALLMIVVPMALLCFATEFTLQAHASTKTRVVVFILNFVVLWLLMAGFASINVQFESHLVDSVLKDVDLSSQLPATASNNSPTVATMLRTTVVPPATRATEDKCTRASPRRIPVSVDYGFPINQWLPKLLPKVPSPSASLTIKLSDIASVRADEIDFPMAFEAAQFLVSSGLRLTDTFFRDSASSVAPLDTFKMNLSTDFVTMEDQDQATVASFLEEMLATTERVMNASAAAHFADFSMDEIEIELAQLPFADSNIQMDMITFRLPMKPEYMRRQVTLQNGTTTSVTYDVSNNNTAMEFQINTKEECGANGCIISARNQKATEPGADLSSQTRALAICMDEVTDREDLNETLSVGTDCLRRSDTSMLVFSSAKKVTGEEILVQLNGENGLVTLRNPRKHYMITVGRLSWKPIDLAAKVGASCKASNGACNGLQFPLAQQQQLIVGQDHLPLDRLRKFSASVMSWSGLVVPNAQEVDMNNTVKGDLIFPRNFNKSPSWQRIQDAYCEVERGYALDLIERNHWFSEDSRPPAYTAALFWLLQNGVVRSSTLASSVPPSQEDAVPTNVRVAVPRKAAWFTYIGCGILLVLSLLIAACGKRKETQIERHFTSPHLARMLLNDPQIPQKLFRCDLLHLDGEQIANSERITAFEISGLQLRHRSKPSVVVQVPKPPTVSASSV